VKESGEEGKTQQFLVCRQEKNQSPHAVKDGVKEGAVFVGLVLFGTTWEREGRKRRRKGGRKLWARTRLNSEPLFASGREKK